MFAASYRKEADKRNLHRGQCTQRIPAIVRDIQSRRIASHTYQRESMERNHIGDEHIATPRRDHVTVKESGQRPPEDGPILDRLNPQIKSKDEQKDRNSFIVVAPGDRSRNVARSYTHEYRSEKARRGRRRKLRRQEVGCERGQARTSRRKEHADVPDVDRQLQRPQSMIDDAAGNHKPRIEGPSSHSSQRMPRPCQTPRVSAIALNNYPTGAS